jgi:hypothetical protein
MNFFTIEFTTNFAAGAHTLSITNVQTSMASPVVPSTATIKTLNGLFIEYKTLSMPVLVPGAFVGGSPIYTISPKTYACPFANYQFNFTTTKAISHLTKIVVTFPVAAGYAMSVINDCINFVGVVGILYYYRLKYLDISYASPLTCTFTANTVKVTNYQDIPIGTNISFTVMGVNNPAAAITGTIL